MLSIVSQFEVVQQFKVANVWKEGAITTTKEGYEL